MRRARAWMVLIVVAMGATTACASGAVEPGIPADTSGPLTLPQAEQLIEEPLGALAESVSESTDEYASFSADIPAEVQEVNGNCLYVSTVYHSTQQVDSKGWGALADAVRPQMTAWEMDTSALDREERAIGAGLRGQNPHNQAELTVRAWNDHLDEELDGPTMGLEMTVQVPLMDSECS
ncbi:MAG: hypothetical protein ACTMII_10110 [Brachybacterium sp.]|uniref:hypothetical protein n=1 Tax=unclassified Brachybacterium TaxID=2623841 RepID=UPI003F9110AD